MDMPTSYRTDQPSAATVSFADADERCITAIDAIDTSDLWNDETPSQIFNSEIDAWARHALATNGFGDLF